MISIKLLAAIFLLLVLIVIEACDSSEEDSYKQERKLAQKIEEPELWRHRRATEHWPANSDRCRRRRQQQRAAVGPEADQWRIKRFDGQNGEPFITVTDDVQTHLSPAIQRLHRAKLKEAIASKQRIKEEKSADREKSHQDDTQPGGEFPAPYLASVQRQRQHQAKRKDDQGEDSLALPIESQPSGSIHKEASSKLVAANVGATYAHRQQAQSSSSLNHDEQHTQMDPFSQLYLDMASVPLVVETLIGQTAYLVCRLRSIQQQRLKGTVRGQDSPLAAAAAGLQVSWRRNMQILTSGLMRFTSDERFKASHLGSSQDWVLEIHNVQASDEGPYECQVNSEPKPASVSLYLRPMVASIEILETQGGREAPLHVGEYDQIRLTCRVDFNPVRRLSGDGDGGGGDGDTIDSQPSVDSTIATDASDPTDSGLPVLNLAASHRRLAAGQAPSSQLSSQHFIFWYKDGVSLEYNNLRGGIRAESNNQPYSMEKVLTLEGASSRLDNGVYECKIQPELSGVSSALVQVIVGESHSSGSAAAIVALSTKTTANIIPIMINLFLPVIIVVMLPMPPLQ